MTKQEFLNYCQEIYGTIPDCPFEADFVTMVLRHSDTKKWYGIIMALPRRKFGFDSDEIIDVVNMKLPVEMRGSFGKADGVYPAYHMNKLHWISILLPDASDDMVRFLTDISFEATKQKKEKVRCLCVKLIFNTKNAMLIKTALHFLCYYIKTHLSTAVLPWEFVSNTTV